MNFSKWTLQTILDTIALSLSKDAILIKVGEMKSPKKGETKLSPSKVSKSPSPRSKGDGGNTNTIRFQQEIRLLKERIHEFEVNESKLLRDSLKLNDSLIKIGKLTVLNDQLQIQTGI